MSKNYTAQISEQGLQSINDLARIALKVHGNNASPVDIKLELAKLPADLLMQIQEDSQRMLNSRKTVAAPG